MLRRFPVLVPIVVGLASSVITLIACKGGSATSDPFDGGSSGGPPDTGESSGTIDGSSGASGSSSSSGSTGSSSGQPVAPASFVVRTIFIGETDRAGNKNKDAWKAYGRNVDNLATNVTASASPDLSLVCKRVQGAPATIHQDGNAGIDNSWGKEVLKLLDPFNPTPTKATNDAITNGARTPMISVDGHAGSFLYAEATSIPPTWSASEKRGVADAWMTAGNSPASIITTGGVGADGYYDSGILGGSTLVTLSFGADGFTVPLHAPSIRMKIAADASSVSDGMISGVVATEELVAEVAQMAGRFSSDLCAGSTVEGIKASIRQASDILLDGSQDPSKTCDGISVGLGFEATRVVVGGVAAPVAPSPDPCQ